MQGLAVKQLNIVFQAIKISRVQYTISAWYGFVHMLSGNVKLMCFLSGSNRSIWLAFDWTFTLTHAIYCCWPNFVQVHSLYRPSTFYILYSILPQAKLHQYTLRDLYYLNKNFASLEFICRLLYVTNILTCPKQLKVYILPLCLHSFIRFQTCLFIQTTSCQLCIVECAKCHL